MNGGAADWTFRPQALGLSGHWIRLSFSTPGQPSAGKPGVFEVVVTLCKAGQRPPRDGSLLGFDSITGDSYVVLGLAEDRAGVKSMPLDVTYGERRFKFIGVANEAGRLSRFIAQIETDTMAHAEAIAFDAVSPILSNLTFLFDVPFEIYQIEANQKESGIRSIWCPNEYETLMSQVPFFWGASPEISAYMSMYREALSSNSPQYQFLCYYKILERLQVRRAVQSERMKQEGRTPSFQRLMIPTTEPELEGWLRYAHQVRDYWDTYVMSSIVPREARGRSLKDVLDNELQSIRNNIAHGLFDDDREAPTLLQSADQYGKFAQVCKWLPLLQTLVRLQLLHDVLSDR